MAKSDLLKEAIADAKAVKETALANAKIALQEAFAPRLERMLATKLTNEIEGEDEMDLEAPIDGDIDAPEEDGAVKWVDNDVSFSVAGATYGAEINNPVDDEMAAPNGDEMDAPIGDEMIDEPAGDEFEDQDELDLESIIRELNGDVDDYEDPYTDSADANHKYEDVPVEDDEYDIDEIIESILREEDEEDEEDEEVEEVEVVTELAEKEAELQEAYKTVKQLKSIINEVNLLNAKLLYTNKLFRSFELSENQKMKVIENFDRAVNTREVKLVFSTIAESLNRPTTKKRIVKESTASKPIASTAPSKETVQILSEGFELANRWKKLAGLL